MESLNHEGAGKAIPSPDRRQTDKETIGIGELMFQGALLGSVAYGLRGLDQVKLDRGDEQELSRFRISVERSIAEFLANKKQTE